MTVTRPDLSIVIATRNRAHKLAAGLVRLASLKTAYSYEVIVVDNDSSDETAKTVDHFVRNFSNISYLLETAEGVSAARNRGWRSVSSDIIAFVDDDIIVAPDYIDRVMDVFADRPHLGFVAGQIRLGDPDDLPLMIDLRSAPEEFPPYGLISTTGLAGANLAFRRACLVAIGGFDPALGTGTRFACEDLDAATRAVWAGWPGGYDPRPVVYHHHGRRTAEDRFRLLRRYDYGRGAYYARFFLRPDTRRTYLRAYLRWLIYHEHRLGDVRRIWREVSAGLRYWWQVHRRAAVTGSDHTPAIRKRNIAAGDRA